MCKNAINGIICYYFGLNRSNKRINALIFANMMRFALLLGLVWWKFLKIDF